MPPNKLEVCGIRCLDCTGLDLKSDPDAAKEGSGRCQTIAPVIFVDYEASRNCREFDPAPAQIAAARQSWVAKLPRWWRR